MEDIRKKFKPFIFVLLFFFCWQFLELYNYSYAFENTQGIEQSQNNAHIWGKFNQIIKQIDNILDKISQCLHEDDGNTTLGCIPVSHGKRDTFTLFINSDNDELTRVGFLGYSRSGYLKQMDVRYQVPSNQYFIQMPSPLRVISVAKVRLGNYGWCFKTGYNYTG